MGTRTKHALLLAALALTLYAVGCDSQGDHTKAQSANIDPTTGLPNDRCISYDGSPIGFDSCVHDQNGQAQLCLHTEGSLMPPVLLSVAPGDCADAREGCLDDDGRLVSPGQCAVLRSGPARCGADNVFVPAIDDGCGDSSYCSDGRTSRQIGACTTYVQFNLTKVCTNPIGAPAAYEVDANPAACAAVPRLVCLDRYGLPVEAGNCMDSDNGNFCTEFGPDWDDGCP